jgi:dTDP-glucose 4,6-dehydratase
VRIFNTYGPGMRPDDGRMIPAFFTQALRGEDLTVFGDGQQTRSINYVSDLVEGIVRLLASDYVGPVNIGNPEVMTVLEVAQRIAKIVGVRCNVVHGDLPPDDPKVRRPDITLARRELGWEPTVTPDEGLRKMLPYFKAELARSKT